MKKILVFLILSTWNISAAAALPAQLGGVFGKSITIGASAAHFPDFSIRLSRIEPAQVKFPDGHVLPLGPYHHFCVYSHKVAKEFSWSSGTGALAPVFFSTSNKCVSLMVDHMGSPGELSCAATLQEVERGNCEKYERSKITTQCN